MEIIDQLTANKYDFSVIEKRVLYLVFCYIKQKHITNASTQYITQNIEMPASQIRKTGEADNEVRNEFRKLENKNFVIDNDEETLYASWIAQSQYDNEKKMYGATVTRNMMKIIADLLQKYDPYTLMIMVTLKSTYARRMYELCLQYHKQGINSFTLSLNELRTMLKIENNKTYNVVNNLKIGVLDIAQKELQNLHQTEQCNLYFTYRTDQKEGRKIASLVFDLHTQDPKTNNTLQEQTKKILEIITQAFAHDADYVSTVKNALDITPNAVPQILEKLTQATQNTSKEELPAVLKYILSQEYGIK